VIEVWVEKLNPALGEDLGWEKDEEAQVLEAARATGARKARSKDTKKLEKDRELARALKKRGDIQTLQKQDLMDLAFAAPTLWKGKVDVNLKDGQQRRLVVAEYEQYLVDDDYPYDGFVSKRGQRMVFVEHVALT
jgi:hypothetical protein